MFFENNSSQRLGCSVLLRGAGINELAKLKRVVSRIVFAEYSWRLEKSFLMDEFARPPSPPTDTFFEEPSQDDAATSPPSKSKLCLLNNSASEKQPSDEVASESDLNAKTLPNKNNSVRSPTEIDKEMEVHKTEKSSDVISLSTADENVKENFKNINKNSNAQTNKDEQIIYDSVEDVKRNSGENKSSPFSNELVDENKSSQCKCLSSMCDMTCEYVNSLSAVEQIACTCGSANYDAEEGSGESKKVDCNECMSNKTQPVRIGSKEKSLSEEKRMNVESVSDFSDPLHLYLNLEDEVFNAGNQSSGSGQWLSVAELPLSNRFRKALDDSILSSSPYLKVIFMFVFFDS